ncbi:uncharacterized protein LOC119585456 [Penaeus monodon]|uniref:uncharacterized protein LOC119585456 n=1 Tax=Penaeus monodon TaxID=6687 RepID=UPI0018A7BA6C|nr:uncharacterized protein LOC119585456 [Penaeus monodon]
MNDIQDAEAFKILAQVLAVWHKDNRDHHLGLWRLPYHGVILFIIGVPYSSYSKYVKHTDQILKPRPDLKLRLEVEETRGDVVTFQAHKHEDYKDIMELNAV